MIRCNPICKRLSLKEYLGWYSNRNVLLCQSQLLCVTFLNTYINTLNRSWKLCVCTFLSCFHAGNKVVALVPAIVLIRIIQWHTHTFVLVPFISDISSFDGVLDALFFSPQTTWTTPPYSKQDNPRWREKENLHIKNISNTCTGKLNIQFEWWNEEKEESTYPSSWAVDDPCSPPLAWYLQTVWKEEPPKLLWSCREQERLSSNIQKYSLLWKGCRALRGTYGGEELLDLGPRCLLAGERERDLDLERERERLRDDLDLLLDLKRGRLSRACYDFYNTSNANQEKTKSGAGQNASLSTHSRSATGGSLEISPLLPDSFCSEWTQTNSQNHEILCSETKTIKSSTADDVVPTEPWPQHRAVTCPRHVTSVLKNKYIILKNCMYIYPQEGIIQRPVRYVCLHTWIVSRNGSRCGNASEMSGTSTWKTLKSESWSEMKTSLYCESDSWSDCHHGHWREPFSEGQGWGGGVDRYRKREDTGYWLDKCGSQISISYYINRGILPTEDESTFWNYF